MRRIVAVLAVFLAWAEAAPAVGILIPTEKNLPPLAMLNHFVTITIEDQVATTKVEQTFRNHTSRQLEATYIFPVPRGASVDRFSMLVNGKEVKGEMVPAEQARKIYTDYIIRTQDPGLVEYLGNNLFKVRVFPVPPNGDQKLTLSYKGILPREGSLVEYLYPLKTSGRAASTLEKFSIAVQIKDQHAISNLYSPTHLITVSRPNDREARVTFERDQGLLDKDFQLFYTVTNKAGTDVSLTGLTHRAVAGQNGYFMLLISPRVEIPREQQLPRDMVFVLDTSGSMQGVKMEQARKGLKYCLSKLGPHDRFGLLNFSTSVTRYTNGLLSASSDEIEKARKWVDDLEATGGTAIDEALKEALDLRPKDSGRTFTIIFFTDGEPTIGETDPQKILKNAAARNTSSTRIFTFGVGDDVNATLLDSLADQTRAVSTYVRPAEDISVKVAALYGKISNPVLTNLKLTAGGDIRLLEVYPPQLPDLFHGGQVVVLGRYAGAGPAALTLTGLVGKDEKRFVYEMTFPEKTNDDKAFVEDIWARRKVGYLLDQIRTNGEKKELVDEVTALAKRYGIATPYTSYLVVPDGPMPVVRTLSRPVFRGTQAPPALAPANGTGAAQKVADFAIQIHGGADGTVAKNRARFEDKRYQAHGGAIPAKALEDAKNKKATYEQARLSLARRLQKDVQTGKLGVELSVQSNNLRNQDRLAQTAQRWANGRNCLEIGGVWIDEDYHAKMKLVAIKAQGPAYFRILERQPRMKEVFRLGNHLVWVAPNGTALVIDTNDGKDKLTDAEIDALFVARK